MRRVPTSDLRTINNPWRAILVSSRTLRLNPIPARSRHSEPPVLPGTTGPEFLVMPWRWESHSENTEYLGLIRVRLYEMGSVRVLELL